MYVLAQIVGIFAMLTLILGYQQKTRKRIILLNALSTLLYITEYILLGAFDGMAIEVVTVFVTLAANRKDRGFVAKNTLLVAIFMELLLAASGISAYQNYFSICLILGAVLQTSSFWLTKEKLIRIVSFISTPFWLVYNLAAEAYGPAVGSAFVMVSIGIAIWRYDIVPYIGNVK